MLEAAHEAAHVFNHKAIFKARNGEFLPPQWLNSMRWFDEATACYMEFVCYRSSCDWLSHLSTWVDKPEASLDDEWPDSWPYLYYLEAREHKGLVSELWNQLSADKTAFDLINSNVTSLPTIGHLAYFGEYCVDSFFANDPTGRCYLFPVYARFGHRAVAWTWELVKGDAARSDTNTLDHLSCRYYRVRFPQNVGSISIEVKTEGISHFECFATLVGAASVGGFRTEPLQHSLGTAEHRLIVNLTNGSWDYLLVTLSNAGFQTEGRSPDGQNRTRGDDQVGYAINVSF